MYYVVFMYIYRKSLDHVDGLKISNRLEAENCNFYVPCIGLLSRNTRFSRSVISDILRSRVKTILLLSLPT